MNETICAIGTPFGVGGIAVIRVSGEDAMPVVDSLFHGRCPLADAPTHTVHHGLLTAQDGTTVDEVVCTVYRAPHSFTGENTVEIACHGSLYIQQTLLQWLIDAGCRAAEPGEFTKRAFLNGRIDLSQAEGIADQIGALSEKGARNAALQMRGSLSNEISEEQKKLTDVIAQVEAIVEYPEENLEQERL